MCGVATAVSGCRASGGGWGGRTCATRCGIVLEGGFLPLDGSGSFISGFSCLPLAPFLGFAFGSGQPMAAPLQLPLPPPLPLPAPLPLPVGGGPMTHVL